MLVYLLIAPYCKTLTKGNCNTRSAAGKGAGARVHSSRRGEEVRAMPGKRAAPVEPREADHPDLDVVGRWSCYGFLAPGRERFCREEDFAALYGADNGRPSVPPRLLATALLLRTFADGSDDAAKARADFALRGKGALGVGLEERPCAKSTLQPFRARLLVHEQVRAGFQQRRAFARQVGYPKGRQVTAARDTSSILGRGAVKGTDNLRADGIVTLRRALAAREARPPAQWALAHGLGRHCGPSRKGGAALDWDDPAGSGSSAADRRRTSPSPPGSARRRTCWPRCSGRPSRAGRAGRPCGTG